MGFRIIENTGAYPASLKGGLLVVKDNLINPIEIPELKTMALEEQRIPFEFVKNVRGVLSNEKFKVILRGDGTFTVYNKVNDVIVRTGYCKALSYDNTTYEPKWSFMSGILQGEDGYRIGNIMSMANGKWDVLFDYSNVIIRDVPMNSFYMNYCRSNLNPKEPVFTLKENQIISKSSLFFGGIEYGEFYKDEELPLRPKGGKL